MWLYDDDQFKAWTEGFVTVTRGHIQQLYIE